MRFQFKECEDNFADCLSDKGLIAKLCKELKKLSNKKSNNTISNCRKQQTQTSHKDERQMVSKHKINYPTSLSFREIRVKLHGNSTSVQ